VGMLVTISPTTVDLARQHPSARVSALNLLPPKGRAPQNPELLDGSRSILIVGDTRA